MQPGNTTHLDNTTNQDSTPQLETAYRSILIAVDSSDHSNQATDDALELGILYQSEITASHVYAAKMHDLRFKQMEGGLPEQFKEEDELERQRDIHDSLITKGLSIITDSYLIQAEQACTKAELAFKGRSLEGKNYKALVSETNNGQYDLLVMGSLGLGAIPGSTIGTVCERVVRRSSIDTLIIKQAERSIKEGPIVAAIDGSKQSYAALITAFNLAKEWQLPLHIVSAFDPYYHYVAFNRIANVLSDEAGKVFRFKEQEQLHEDIIDDGLAKIYQSHLEVAQQLAQEHDVKTETHLLTGKPHHAIEQYIDKTNASLLIIGKIGIHCDDELDIGGNSENLLRNSSCALLLTQRQYTPKIEMLAESTTSWSTQAEEAMTHIPPFVQNMARAAILRYAQSEGHTVITASIVAEATKNMCPAGMKNLDDLVAAATDVQAEKNNMQPVQKQAVGAFNMQWSAQANEMLQQVSDTTLRHNTKMRAEKRALTEKSTLVEVEHILPFVVNPNVKNKAQNKQEKKVSQCPFASMGASMGDMSEEIDLPWDEEALERLKQIPEGASRDMTKKASNAIAQQQGIKAIDYDFLQQILSVFNSGSKQASSEIGKTLPWDDDAKASISKAPPMVQGMLAKEIEAFAKREKLQKVDLKTAEKAKQRWSNDGQFHLDPNDPRNAH